MKLLWNLVSKLGKCLNYELSVKIENLLCLERESFIKEMLSKEKYDNPKRLERYAYRVYSQHGEDGMISEIFNRIGLTNKIFIEFGVGNGLENNTTYLLFQGWKGLWIEGSERSAKQISKYFRKYLEIGDLILKNEFITCDNIDCLISSFTHGEIDLLSVDIDGNDYYVLERIQSISARVIVVEYNPLFPPSISWIMDYDPNYVWDGGNKSGASLSAFVEMLDLKGYQLVSTDITGTNAFFVRKDLCMSEGKNLFFEPAIADLLYHPALYFLSQKQVGHPIVEF